MTDQQIVAMIKDCSIKNYESDKKTKSLKVLVSKINERKQQFLEEYANIFFETRQEP